MHSLKEKFKYFIKIQSELYDIIYDCIDLDIVDIVKYMNKHLDSYNKKSTIYTFKLTEEVESNTQYQFLMIERKNYIRTPLYKDTMSLREIIRNRKIDNLLGDFS